MTDKSKWLWKTGNKINIGIPMMLLYVLVFTSLIGCDTSTETVSIDEVVWSAVREPENFDTFLASKTLDARTPNCLFQHRDVAFSQELAKLQECGVILQGSPAWHDCHDEADAFHNNGVLMNDIASAINGPGRFEETESYRFFLIAKLAQTEIDWNAFVDALDEVTPPYVCEYEGEEQWFWE